MFVIIVLLGVSVGYNIYQRKEIKRLNNCWDDVFNAKLESENRWKSLCDHYLEKITDLTAEQKDVK